MLYVCIILYAHPCDGNKDIYIYIYLTPIPLMFISNRAVSDNF